MLADKIERASFTYIKKPEYNPLLTVTQYLPWDRESWGSTKKIIDQRFYNHVKAYLEALDNGGRKADNEYIKLLEKLEKK